MRGHPGDRALPDVPFLLLGGSKYLLIRQPSEKLSANHRKNNPPTIGKALIKFVVIVYNREQISLDSTSIVLTDQLRSNCSVNEQVAKRIANIRFDWKRGAPNEKLQKKNC